MLLRKCSEFRQTYRSRSHIPNGKVMSGILAMSGILEMSGILAMSGTHHGMVMNGIVPRRFVSKQMQTKVREEGCKLQSTAFLGISFRR